MSDPIAEDLPSTRKLIHSDQKDGEKRTETKGKIPVKLETSAVVDDPRMPTSANLLSSSSSFWHRKLDGLYWVFFLTHIPVILRTSLISLAL